LHPKTLTDNSKLKSIPQVPGSPVVFHTRPGSVNIMRVEESTFYLENHLYAGRFRTADELKRYIDRLIGHGKSVPYCGLKTAFDKAQALIYKTVGVRRGRQIRYAREALSIYRNCADAYVVLAQYQKDPDMKIRMLRHAVLAGERALKDLGLQAGNERRYWPAKARPYMRARLALANALYENGEEEAAISEYEEILRLNPNDNQGVRYLLVHAYLKQGRDQDAKDLRREWDDPASTWAFTDVYLAYKDQGDTPFSRSQAVYAYYSNPYIPSFLLGAFPLPRKLPEKYRYGDEDEAVIYAQSAKAYWGQIEGLLPWLKRVVTDITGGLPYLAETERPSMRYRIAKVWRKVRSQGRSEESSEERSEERSRACSKGRFDESLYPRRIGNDKHEEKCLVRWIVSDESLAQALLSHREFAAVWEIAGNIGDSFEVGYLEPVRHVAAEAVMNEVIERSESDASKNARSARDYLMSAGMTAHEARHFLALVYAYQWFAATREKAPLDLEALASKFRWVKRLASGEISPSVGGRVPRRNDSCPCGSGRKFKRCCGRSEGWPIETVKRLAECLRGGKGKIPPQADLGFGILFSSGRYAEFSKLKSLPEDHPLVLLENTSFVGRQLVKQGLLFSAYVSFRNNVELARSLRDKELLRIALEDMVQAVVGVGGFEFAVEKYAAELARLTVDAQKFSYLWSLVAEARMKMTDMKGAEEALKRALSVEKPDIYATLVWARFLRRRKRLGQSLNAYQEVLARCRAESNMKVTRRCAEAEMERVKRAIQRAQE